MNRKEIAVVLRQAAERIAANQNSHCCFAIDESVEGASFGSGIRRNLVKAFFAGLFKPTHRFYGTSWFGEPSVPENQKQRILSLLFAADYIENGGRIMLRGPFYEP